MQRYNLKDALIAEVRNRYQHLSPQEIDQQWQAAWAEIDRELNEICGETITELSAA